MDRKICPLTFANTNVDEWCVKEKCEWWNGDECSVRAITKQLEEIATSLKLIARGYIDDGK
ncbi:MAG: hypothetical protein QXV73_04020 [Candidatus Micrarchaeia archaeon]